MFDDSILMVKGGTDSFGQTVLNRFLNTGGRAIRVCSRDEKDSLRAAMKGVIKSVIGKR